MVAPGKRRGHTLKRRGIKNGDLLTIESFGTCEHRDKCYDSGNCPGYIYMKEVTESKTTTGCWSLYDDDEEAEWTLKPAHELDIILGV